METIAPLKTLTTPEVQPLASGFNTIIENIASTTENDIGEGSFVTASIGIRQLEQMESFIKPLVAFLQTYNEQVQTLVNSLQELEETTSDLVQSLDDAEKLISD